MAKIKIIEVEQVPICPHCKNELHEIGKLKKGFIEQHVVYICMFCRAVLSIGYNLGW
jgi:DNA-directed RNA polymerase subunit RPC12/RpoP